MTVRICLHVLCSGSFNHPLKKKIAAYIIPQSEIFENKYTSIIPRNSFVLNYCVDHQCLSWF